VPHIHIDNVGAGVVVIPPEAIEDLLAGEHLHWVAQKEFGKQELAGGEVDGAIAHPDLTGQQIQGNGAAAQGGFLGDAGHLAVPQLHPNTGQQFLKAKGLGDVVIGSTFQTGDGVFYPIPRRQDDDRKGLALAAKGSQDRKTILIGQAQVEDHQINAIAIDHLQRIVAGANGDGREAVGLQARFQKVRDAWVVFDDENPIHGWCYRNSAQGASRW